MWQYETAHKNTFGQCSLSQLLRVWSEHSTWISGIRIWISRAYIWSLHNTCRGHQLRLTECCPSVWPRQIPLRVQIKVDGPESLEIKHEQTEASFPGDLRRCQIFERSVQQCWLFNFSKIKILCMKITWRGQLTGWSRVSSKQHSSRNIKDE